MVSRFQRWPKSINSIRPFIVLSSVMVVSLIYMLLFFNRGWIPQDEGVLGQQAVRWLAGELPHRDFHETYTGGLTILNGLAFSVLGTDALSLRYMLLAVALACLFSVYFIFRSVLSVYKTAVLTLVTLAWSFPNYFAGLPSWYVITFWCFGLYCLSKHDGIISSQKEPSSRGGAWLFLFGVFLGFSVLIKINGIFFMAVAVLYLCHLASMGSPRPLDGIEHPSRLGNILVVFIVLAFLGCVFWIFRLMPTLGGFYFLFVPNLFISLYLMVRIIKNGGISNLESRKLLFRCCFVFGGFFVTVLPFLLYYLHQGALVDLMFGLFVRPVQRVLGATYPFPGVRGTLCGLILPVVLVAGILKKGEKIDWLIAWLMGVALSGVLIAKGNSVLQGLSFFSVRTSGPPLVVTLCLLLMFNPKGWSAPVMHRLFLATVSLSVASLIQFPDAYVIYFYYTAPFLLILFGYIGALSFSWPRSFIVFCGFLLLFPPIVLTSVEQFNYVPLGLPCASLLVPEEAEKIYYPLVKRIQSLTKQGEPVFSGPDCPEISFLSERPNPTGILYEMLEKKEEVEADVLSVIQNGGCPVAVLNLQPGYSVPYSQNVMNELKRRYKRFEKYGHFILLHNDMAGGK